MEKKKDQGEITLEVMPAEDLRKFTLELSSSLKYNGEDYDKLTFDFHALTGADALNIEEEMQAIGRMVLVPSLSGEFMIRIAANGADILAELQEFMVAESVRTAVTPQVVL